MKNSEASASEFPEDHEGMFLLIAVRASCMDADIKVLQFFASTRLMNEQDYKIA